VTLTARDEDILKTLALKVRMLSIAQITSAWWAESASAQSHARRRLRVLMDADLLLSLQLQARPLPPMDTPVARWRPGSRTPEFGPIAWKLQSRWTEPPCRTTIYFASKKAANHYGGRLRGEIKHDLQATHDLGVAQIYLHLFRNNPESAANWVGEDVLRLGRRGEKIPDAVLVDGSSRSTRLVVEFGGAYDADRVRSFHRHCATGKLPYEIW
jgi:hypothetical protein